MVVPCVEKERQQAIFYGNAELHQRHGGNWALNYQVDCHLRENSLIWYGNSWTPNFDWELFATTAWGLWKNRNSFKHEGRCKPARCIVREASRFVEELKQSTMTNPKPPKQPRQTRPQWRPPDTDWYKINVDGATFMEISYYGIGVIIRNEKGKVMGAMSKKLPLPLGAMEVEAKAVEEGITLARNLGLGKVIVGGGRGGAGGDALTVMSALSSLNQPPSSIKKVVEGSLHLLQSFK